MESIGEPSLSGNSDTDSFLNNSNDESTTQIIKNVHLDKSHDEKEKDTTVRVAVRIRPQIAREMIDMCRICTKVTPGENHVILGSDNVFTFDYVFDTQSLQSELYSKCVENLVEGSLKGYNATVLAYGQTGSGKTYTMGTGFDRVIDGNVEGIIPRAVRHIFSGIESIQEECQKKDPTGNKTMQFSVAIQFMELYNEDIIDLLDPYNKGRVFKIHEDTTGSISVSGATIRPINGPQEALQCLQQGALARTTASTQMNEQSSRSHALFTILIRRQRVMSEQESGLPQGDLETLTSKFHFVDLAGSERLKRTGATGERAREGISINCGLLALGNVISALGDKSKRATHVPYRDSKLTRLLQDSLGGNSQTIMIACVSPSDRDFMETLNTLKYANRARNIKNKVMLNQDQNSRIIAQLRKEISDLQLELIKYKNGNVSVNWIEEKGNFSDLHEENRMLSEENKKISQRLKVLKETIDQLTKKNSDLLIQTEMHNYNTSNSDKSMPDIVGCYIHEIEILKSKLIESELKCEQYQKAANTPRPNNYNSNVSDIDMNDFITTAKLSLQKKLEIMSNRTIPSLNEVADNLPQEMDESPESDSDTESEDKAAEMVYELDTISSDIELKSKLIEQLELSQERMLRMRQHYEEKLNLLGAKIQKTQKERDQVLANMNTSPNQLKDGNEKVKKVREEYERKISELQKELRKLQSAQKEHLRQQRAIHSQDVQLRTLRCDLAELKSTKIRLIRKMNEETSRHKEEETRKTREIAQLRKESRKQQTAVKSLQAQVAAKDQVLKRKTEQVSALRKTQRGGLSNKAAGLVPPKKVVKQFVQRAARSKWENLNRNINRVARNKQVVIQLEHELERLINDREMLSKEIANLRNKPRNLNEPDNNGEEEDSLKANLNYIQQNIEHVQQTIMEFEESKGSPNEHESLQNGIDGITSVEEAKFLLAKLAENSISNNCDSIFLQNKLIETESMLKDIQQESTIQQQLLQHFLTQNPSVQITDLFDSLHLKSAMTDSVHSLQSNMTFDIPPNEQINNTINSGFETERTSNIPTQEIRPSSPTLMRASSILSNSEFSDRTPKVRRRTAHPQDLLFGESEVNHNGEDSMTQSYTQQDQSPRSFIPLARVPSAPGSLKQGLNSPSLTRKNIENIVPVSPRLNRRQISNKGSPGLEEDVIMPAQSPPVYRRLVSREDPIATSGSDVFSRLGAGTQDPSPGGSIQKVGGKIRIGVPLYCTHTVSGHNNSVLAIKVDGNILYTAAADRTVKVWDLSQETAQHCLSTHPGPVIAVQNDINTSLLYSASGPFVRVWDLRMSNTKPIKTLCSSGQLVSGTSNISGITPGESPITALCLGGSGNLYVAASDKVRIWDIRSMSCLGKLAGGHQAAVMCVTSWEGSGNTDFIATGSKDHYVKVFEVPSSGGVVYPLLNLEPPHYDGVQALAVAPDALGADAELFSGSRDSGIKRWDLKSGELKQSLNNAHKGWVSGMAISGDVLLSSCRGGIIRLWNVKSCESLAELKTDSSINDIVASGQRVFTASSSGEVRIWRFTPQDNFSTSMTTSSTK